MEELREAVESLVSSGIRAYIGLLCSGERSRSRKILSDTMQISSIASGGPSRRVPVVTRGCVCESHVDGVGTCVLASTLRSMLASLLVLRTTAYWNRLSELEHLQEACSRLGDVLMSLNSGHNESDDDPACTCASRPSPPRNPQPLRLVRNGYGS